MFSSPKPTLRPKPTATVSARAGRARRVKAARTRSSCEPKGHDEACVDARRLRSVPGLQALCRDAGGICSVYAVEDRFGVSESGGLGFWCFWGSMGVRVLGLLGCKMLRVWPYILSTQVHVAGMPLNARPLHPKPL